MAIIRGTTGNDSLRGGTSADTIYGEGGNDTLDGGGGNDILYGGIGTDSLIGGAGSDTLDGGAGADIMRGGTGDDNYIVDNIADSIFENANEGIDTVNSSVSYILGSNVERLTQTGSGNINGTGNALDNILVGNSANNNLNGGDGNDDIWSASGNDVVDGGNGNDNIAGGGLGDTLTGGAGNDTFIYQSVSDSPSSSGWDVITDFTQGSDKIELIDLLGATDLAWGNTTPTSNGVWYANLGTSTFVYADVDGNGIADITVELLNTPGMALRASDFTGVAAPANSPPIITSPANFLIDENVSTAGTVTATDTDGDTLTFSIIGGADAAMFTINATTGGLSFLSAPNYEAPADSGGNNVYDLQVQVSDGISNSTQNISVTVSNVNDNGVVLVDSNAAANSVAENATNGTVVGITALGTDADAGATVSYSLTDDAGGRFAINANTGVVTVANGSLLDYESAQSHSITVLATSTDGSSTGSNFTINVTNVNDNAPSITSPANYVTAENTAAVGSVVATDADGDAVTYSITGGADQALFAINATTGALSFVAAPDYEAPADAGANNVYDVIVTASDGTNNTPQAIAVTVSNANDNAPVITSGAAFTVAENMTAVATVTATDADGNTVSYSITGGADAALFAINTSTGALTFVNPPDYENPADVGGNNIYEVIVTASDGTNDTPQVIEVSVSDTNDNAPAITSPAAYAVAENTTAVGTVSSTDADGDTVSYSITGGADAALFAINATTGELSFVAAPDYEAPADAGANNVYDLIVTASDGTNNTPQNIAVTIANVNDNGVILVDGNGAANSVAENAANGTTVGITALGTDADAGATVSYTLINDAGGRFAIDTATGVVTVADGSLLNYEAATSHTVSVLAMSNDGSASISDFTIDVTNASEYAPNIENGSVSLAENTAAGSNVYNVNDSFTLSDQDRDGDAITYSISAGNDAGIFAIDAATGQITIATGKSLDFETAQSHSLTVTASDGSLSDTAIITVDVTNVNDNAPSITSPASYTMAENTTAVGTVSSTDADGDTVSYSITGGADAALFAINATTGELSFVAAPDYEAPADAGANNVYDVIVAASDGTNNTPQNIAVTIANVNDNGVVLVDSNVAANSVAEGAANGTLVGITALGTDADAGATVSYSLTDDAGGRFAINASSGVVTVADGSLLNYESAQSHSITVLATSSDGSIASGNFTINVANANDNPLDITSASSFSVNENSTAVATVTSSDADGGAPNYFLIGSGDAALFNIDQATGELSFKSAPNFEAPADIGGDNVYNVKVVAVDGLYYDMQDIAITVNNVNEFAPAISTGAAFTVAENSTAVTTVAAADGDNDTITYSISGGADSTLFSIDPTTGALSFVSPPDFEAPVDAGANNVYDVVVMASDGDLSSTKDIAVTVTNINDNAPVITTASSVNAAENSTAAVTLTSTDADNIGTRTYSIVGGADAALFNINASSGVVTFKTAQNYEAPGDAGANGVYDISVRVSDGTLFSNKDIAISLTNVNEAPVASSSIAETNLNTAVSGTVTASDVDNANSELTTTLVTGPLHGTVVFGPNQTYTYTPTAGYWGGDSFTFNVKDPGNLTSSTGTVSINVAGMSDSGEFIANTYTTNAQFGETDFQDTMAALSDGGFVSLWVSNMQDGSQYGVFGQRFDASGNKAGTEFQVNTTTSNNQHYASVTGLAGGGFVATWGSYGQVSGFNFEVYGQRFDASGNKVGGEFLINTIQANNYDQYRSSIAGLSGGGFVVTWDSMGQDAVGTTGIYGQRYDASGNKVGGEFLVNTTTAGSQTSSSVASLLNDGFVVTWGSPDANGSGIYGQRFNGSGVKVGGEFLVNTTTTGAQTNANVHAFSDGGFIVTWTSPDVSGTGIYGQRFDAGGVKVGVEFLVNSTTAGTQSLSSADVLSDGGFIVTWTSNEPDGTTGIYAQRFDAAGVKLGGEFHVNSTMTGTQSISEVVGLKNGGFAVDWTSDQTNPGSVEKDVYVKIYSDLPGSKTLVGTSANDALIGGALNDVLTGFGGNDMLTGLGGNDTFVYRLFTDKGTTGDVITDFSKGGPNGTDHIDLSIMLDTFAGYDGSNALTGGYVQFIQSGADTLVQVDSDGGGNDFVTLVTLVGVDPVDMTNYVVM